jgi:Na+/H+-dicarboxylate symporter/ABC-type amino acid transport substrate-binding protein
MSSSRKILIGLTAGAMVGLFFGERAAILEWAADGFVKLLQMTVLPYITVSIVSSLGRLDLADARRLGLRVGAVVTGLWCVALAYAFLIPLTFPSFENASFYSNALVERRAPFDFVALYIPANPFYSLANNIVPAVVLFSVLVGVALIGVERKALLLEVLQVAAEAISRATRFVARLTPYGLFAIAATTAGTLNFEQLGRLQIYLIAYVAVALLVSLWVLPGLVAALTPIPQRELLRTTRDPLLTAFVAGDLFIVLPALIDASKTLIERYRIGDRGAMLPDVIVPASFNLPHSGKLLSISFVLFASWFADVVLSTADHVQLAFSGLITFFGSLNAAVPFLLDLFRIPADTFQLFLATGVINSRFGTLLAAVHTVAVALIGTSAMLGALTWNRRRAVRFVMTTVVLTVAVLGGARALFATALVPEYRKDKVLAGMQLLQTPTPAVVHTTLPPDDGMAAGESVLDAIRRRGRIRVGYLPDSLPYAFFNGNHQLVGLDVDLAHRLASELGVQLELVPAPRDAFAAVLAAGRCDLVMSGVVVTTERASQQLFSASYMDETLGLLVLDYDRNRFSSWAAIGALGAITIGTPDVPYFMAKLRQLLPSATFRPLHRIDEVFGPLRVPADAIAFPAERGSAWTLLHPEWSVIVPEGTLVKIPLAYPIARNDEAFATFLNTWIDLKRKDGTMEALFKYWILGQNAGPRQRRWSIAADVLGWID